jgi:hypothetical protein
LFDEIPNEFNFAAHVLNRDAWYNVNFPEDQKKELLSGTLFVRNCAESKEVVKEWIDECKSSKEWEQRVLDRVLKRNNVKVYELPIEYCWIKTLPNGSSPFVKCDNPIIVHNQCSRQLRNQIK